MEAFCSDLCGELRVGTVNGSLPQDTARIPLC